MNPLRTLAGTALAWLLSPVLLSLGYVLRRAESPCPEASPRACRLYQRTSWDDRSCMVCGFGRDAHADALPEWPESYEAWRSEFMRAGQVTAADFAAGVSVHETCYKCGRPADERIAERRRKLAERNPDAAAFVAKLRPVCSVCAWENIQRALSEDSDAEDIAAMTDEEVDATLRGQGVDVDAFVARMRKAVAKAKRDAGGAS